MNTTLRRRMTVNTGISWLDFKLGVRMLLKHPGVTLVSIFALTVGIGIGAAWFEFTRAMFSPDLPLPDADRIVAVQNWDAAAAAPELRALHDFETWRAESKTIQNLGAATGVEYAVGTEGGRFATASGAQITASAFRVARVAPLLGRPLLPEDERPDAPPVVVIGYDLWQRLFDGDRGVLGETVRLGSQTATVVGVMPDGFGFPVNQEVWTPLRASPLEHARREGPAIRVFGRLAPGVSLEEAGAEFAAIGERTAAAFPEANRQLRPRVRPYLESFFDQGPLLMSAFNIPFLLLLVVICVNVATLVFARTAARQGELVVRSALGASRARLVLQLFAEALVVTSLAAAAGLVLAHWGMQWGMELFWQIQESRPPFWSEPGLSLSTVLYTGLLVVVSAALVGAVPALRVTGRTLRAGLSQTASGGSGLRFGRISTAMIVVQVAIGVVFLPIALTRTQDVLGDRLENTGFPAQRYLSARLVRQSEIAPEAMSAAARVGFVARTAELQDEVRRRLAQEPGVSAVAFADRVPGMNHLYASIQLAQPGASPDSASPVWARALEVDEGFFDAMNAPIVAGRGFRPADRESGIGVAVVDQTFVREHLAGRNAVGQRLRYPDRAGEEGERWYEIVGVVEDLAMNAYGPGGYQDVVQTGPAGYIGVYHPLRPGAESSVQMFVRTDAPDPLALMPRIHSVVTSLDPTLALNDLETVEQLWRPAHRGERLLSWITFLVVAIVVGLAAAGIYALMSFTVTQRTREIGIRTALGAGPHRITLVIFSRAFVQIALGVLLGAVVFALGTGVETLGGAVYLAGMAAVMLGVGLLACTLPARRALRIEPTEALKADG